MTHRPPIRTPSLLSVLLLSIVLYVASNCAQVAQPPGGKKDTLAPKLIDSYPKMRARNVKPKQVELFFNEYITAENLPQKVIITPGSGITFDYKVKPTSVVLTFNEPLKDSTTYTISFTDAIKDATERNPATNMKLVFSTGNLLDSLSISGQVSDIVSGTTTPAGTLVGLYAPRDTLDAVKNKPIYYSKTDTSGRFQIENIRGGEYDVIAFTDQNNNFVFNAQSETVGFASKRIKLNQNISDVQVYLFNQNNTTPRISRNESRSDSYVVNLSKGIESYSVAFRNPADSMASMLLSANQIKFFRTVQTADTVGVRIAVRDSLGTETNLRHTISFRPKSKREKPEEFSFKPVPAPNEPVEPDFDWVLKFSKPVKNVDPKRIQISVDSLTKGDLTLAKSSTFNTTLTELTNQFATKARKFVRFKISKDAFTSVLGDTITTTTITYPIADPENFGLVRGQVITKEPHYILELIDEQKTVARRLRDTPTYTFRNLKPGRYRLRLIIDTNNNNKWDTGRYEFRIPAEPIIYLSDKLLIKQNFELDDIDITY
ncbi:Ig-like domain-containing protein [Fibrella sp. HMF5335]|uniref:Ig-like domain-containing protein n=1 Tax=Fibrella rubiginis TaxID=2817060 RepID=A0A939K7A2_9BACT|nr:Ig-like domain-containing protein [Fibrella rubiginis]MBO0939728.1 Ig-like domain-containing protein [Fibrella rubiginis]